MQLSTPTFPRPADLPPFSVTPPFELGRDAQVAELPRELDDGITLPLQSSATWGDDGEWPIDDWFASSSTYEDAYRMTRPGFTAALAGARELAKGTEAVAVVQATDGARWLVPLGVWNPVDESQLTFEDAGGTPYVRSPQDYVRLGRNEGPADVEAVVFGDEWINMTGHPIQLPAG